MFTKQHYEFLANWIKTGAFCTTDPIARTLFASSLADRLERDNFKFNRARFLNACGLKVDPVQLEFPIDPPKGWAYVETSAA